MLARNNTTKKKKIRGHSEYDLQCNCVEWFRANYKDEIIFSVPIESAHAKFSHYMKSGALAGVSDLIVVLKTCILFIEMKSENGRQRDVQKEFQKMVEALGYKYFLCRTLDNFKDIIMSNI